MFKSYKFRIYPNKEQRVLLAKTFGCTRFIWNKMFGDKEEYYKKTKKNLNVTPAMYKEEFPWLKEVDSLSLANVQMQLNQSYTNFSKNKKHFNKPKFKSKHSNKNSYTTNKNAKFNNIQLLDGYIKLPKLTPIKIKQHRELPDDCKLKSVTVSKSASDKYYASILVEYEKETIYEKDIAKTVGLDMSMTDFVVTSDGEKANHPHWLKKSAKKLARQQRKLSNKVKGSNNYLKQKKRVAIVHEKIANQRKDSIEKASRGFINRFDYIVLEDINLQQMSSNLSKYKLGKSVADLGFGMFRTRLEQKANEEGKEVIKIDKWFPSSQLCSSCGYRHHDLKLSERCWTCPDCNTAHDRDINASINLKNKFLADKQINTVGTTEFQACGEKSSGSLTRLVSETNLVEAGNTFL